MSDKKSSKVTQSLCPLGRKLLITFYRQKSFAGQYHNDFCFFKKCDLPLDSIKGKFSPSSRRQSQQSLHDGEY